MSIAPVAEAARYCLTRLGMKRWKSWVSSYELMCRYCVTPPVTPYWTNTRDYFSCRHSEECIACGKVHVTSEDCGSEKPERQFRNSIPRRHDGYSLQRAANMGCFADSDNWD